MTHVRCPAAGGRCLISMCPGVLLLVTSWDGSGLCSQPADARSLKARHQELDKKRVPVYVMSSFLSARPGPWKVRSCGGLFDYRDTQRQASTPAGAAPNEPIGRLERSSRRRVRLAPGRVNDRLPTIRPTRGVGNGAVTSPNPSKLTPLIEPLLARRRVERRGRRWIGLRRIVRRARRWCAVLIGRARPGGFPGRG